MIINNEYYLWHPVGSHAQENLIQIIDRKKNNIKNFGLTYWSLKFITIKRIESWKKELKNKQQFNLSVICCGDNTKDPSGSSSIIYWQTQYSEDLNIWKNLPFNKMTSYHHTNKINGATCSAFVVKNIIVPTNKITVKRPNNWFYSKKQIWNNDKLPTRGEFLVKNVEINQERGQNLKFILELESPFVVHLRT